MKINEVEKLLNVPMATIRFYKKEGLLTPHRNENSYREYSEADVQLIKKIIVFRKIGLSVEQIKRILEGNLSLQDALSENLFVLQEKMKELEGAVNLCMEIQKKNQNNDGFETEFYWDLIHKEEEKGCKFYEIINDVISYEKRLFADEFDLLDEEGTWKHSFPDSIVIAAGICILCGGLGSAMHGMSGGRFLQGLLFPLLWIGLKSILGLPFLLIGREPDHAAKKARRLWQIIIVTILAAAIFTRIFI